jgi:uncharacterized repeat protein (TIGR03837 family)
MQADLFCRVVDNFGDIGVSWRFARQLQREHGWEIRLWVDDLAAFQRIEPSLDITLEQQHLQGVEIRRWLRDLPLISPHPIVIAAFSCELPMSWLQAMKQARSIWINLEYLSAEDWVEHYHGLPSLRQDGLKPYFFFPGFTNKTGGLPRENDLVERRISWTANHTRQARFLSEIGLPPDVVQVMERGSITTSSPLKSSDVVDDSASLRPRLVSLFCYPHAPYHALLDALDHDHQTSILLVPDGVCPGITPGQSGKVQVLRIPFLSQDKYDQLLWTCDLNFVRGEDSFMRATWAGKPFIWQIYPQQEDAHLIKLDAWLARTALPQHAQDCQRAWNHPHQPIHFRDALVTALEPDRFQDWKANSVFLSDRLSQIPTLADSITRFCRQSNIHPDRIK